MASSPAVTSSAAKPLDPLRQSKFTVLVSDGLLSKPRETVSYSSVRCKSRPASQSLPIPMPISPPPPPP
ncbi:MAG: hypothetical protein INR71_00495 [Terriglobus roseus]|nr:hypothetical protein [Terriglobus roseus]